MIKKLLFLTPIFLFVSTALDIESDAAPASATGAPGETDCTRSGCHSTFIANSGTGMVKIIPQVEMSNYVPGQTYTVTLQVSESSVVRFGFQLVALRDADNINVGTLSPIDGSRNQIVPGYGGLSDRKYMTYTFKSTSAISTPGSQTWYFKWTAPSSNVGPITFYAAGIAADNDGTDDGDQCYTTSLKISSDAPVISASSLQVFPNPVKDKINLTYSLNEANEIKIDLADVQGRMVEQLYSASQDKGTYQLSLALSNRYKGGIYFLRFEQNGKMNVKKIFIAD